MKLTGRVYRILVLLPVALAVFSGGKKIDSLLNDRSAHIGSNPGYFEQWYKEKMGPDGKIPAWQHAAWAAWDRSRLSSRGAEDLIDSVLEIGPQSVGGRTRSLWVDPRNDQYILAAAISGGVWRSENGGSNWVALNDHESSLMASCFTSNPFNPDIVYYGTGEGRANSADVDGNGIYKSTDGGRTFSVIPSTVGLAGFETIWDIKHSLDDSNTIFVGTNSRGLWRTTNGGQSWEQVITTSSSVNNILVLPNHRVIAGIHGQFMQVSDSAGKKGTFTQINNIAGWPSSGTYRRVQMDYCKKYPNVVYALLEGFGFSDPPAAFFKSSNGGRTWIKQNNPNSGPGYQAYCVMLGVNPIDSNVVVAGGVYIAQTNNGGQSWTNKSTGHSDHHAFAGFTTNTDYFLVGTDGGVYKYRYNSGGVFANLNKGYQVTQFYAGSFGPGGQVAISGAQDNGTHVATRPLVSKQFYGADGAYAHIGLQDGKVAYFSTQNAGIRRIRNFNPYTTPGFTDDISDPSFSSDGVNFINAYAMNPADQNQLYYRTNKYIYRTNDGGELWDPITNIHSGMKAIGISNHDNPVVYAGGSAAQLYKIENAKNATQGSEYSFNSVFPMSITSDFINSIVVHPQDKYTIFISFSNYNTQPRVWRISGLDSSKPVFTNISGDLPSGLPVNYVAVDPENPDKNLFAGTDFGLYYSSDSGKTWVKELRVPNVAVHEIKMRSDRKLFVFTHGRGIWYIALKPGAPNSAVRTAHQNAAALFPNPVSNELHIRLANQPVRASYRIYNLRGELVLNSTLLETKQTISTSELQNGFYFVRIENDGIASTHRILVSR